MLPTWFKSVIPSTILQLQESAAFETNAQHEQHFAKGIQMAGYEAGARQRVNRETATGKVLLIMMMLHAFTIMGNACLQKESEKQVWLLVCGWVSWTFAEYLLHRFVISCKRFWVSFPVLAQKWSRGVQYSRFQRLNIMLLFTSLMIAGYSLQSWIMYLAGLAMGWLGYSYLRIFANNRVRSSGSSASHRHANAGSCIPVAGFGWSTLFWDWVFGTLPPKH